MIHISVYSFILSKRVYMLIKSVTNYQPVEAHAKHNLKIYVENVWFDRQYVDLSYGV